MPGLAVPAATSPVLVFVHLLAVCVWVGGFVAIAVVARAASRTLDAQARVDFFRALGRSYGMVGGGALLVGIGTGAVLLADRPWDATASIAVALAAAVVLATVAGVIQARGMTRLRQEALERDGSGDQVARGAKRAAILRGAIGVLTIALLIAGAALVT